MVSHFGLDYRRAQNASRPPNNMSGQEGACKDRFQNQLTCAVSLATREEDSLALAFVLSQLELSWPSN